MPEEKKLIPAEWGKQLGKRRRMLGVPGAMRGAGIPMDKPVTQSEFERAMNRWRKKPAYITRVAPPSPTRQGGTGAVATPAEDLEIVHPAEEKKGGKK